MARVISKEVTEIKHSPSNLPLRRQQLRIFASYVFGTFASLKRKLNGGPVSHEEREFLKRLTMIEKDLHTQLASIGCDVGE
ncbi:TPA: hypothetical protein RHW64_000544 [Escherichia coli]|nr:hypothetical protein [Escherichia coli]EFC5347025.1 hypothetical protein [Escherichia coli]EGO6650630.1 hypothetical protein [Escherichia coli]EGO6727063.1 hypothetical protein [Escherichia coli]EGO9653055.1 hypothetical protein [Escherichia coli]